MYFVGRNDSTDMIDPATLPAAVAFGVALATPDEIDVLNILRASLLAMRRAVEALAVPADFLFIDAKGKILQARGSLSISCSSGGNGTEL